MIKYQILLLLLLTSCMGNFNELNPVRVRVDESLSGSLGIKNDIVVGSTSYSFVVCGDIHTGSGEVGPFDRIMTATAGGTDQFLVMLGDLVDWGKASEYDVLSAHLAKYTYPHGKFQVVGNHDIFFDGWDSFKQHFGPSVYTFTSENSRFIMLDSANATFGRQQLDWLEDVLSSNTKDHIFIFTHVGIYTGTISSIFKLSSQDEIYRFHYLMKKYGVGYVFAGHYHVDKHFEIDGVNYVISGGSNDGMLDSGPNHYKRISITPTGVTVTSHRI